MGRRASVSAWRWRIALKQISRTTASAPQVRDLDGPACPQRKHFEVANGTQASAEAETYCVCTTISENLPRETPSRTCAWLATRRFAGRTICVAISAVTIAAVATHGCAFPCFTQTLDVSEQTNGESGSVVLASEHARTQSHAIASPRSFVRVESGHGSRAQRAARSAHILRSRTA
jgi:hypothetical protein